MEEASVKLLRVVDFPLDGYRFPSLESAVDQTVGGMEKIKKTFPTKPINGSLGIFIYSIPGVDEVHDDSEISK